MLSATVQLVARKTWRPESAQPTFNLLYICDGRSEDRIPVEARFSATAETGPGAHSASHTMGKAVPLQAWTGPESSRKLSSQIS